MVETAVTAPKVSVRRAKKQEKRNRRLRVDIKRLHPNTWNPNVMDSTMFEKLKRNLKRLLDSGNDALPPLVVRPHNAVKDDFEIIDGEHRWRALKELGQTHVNIFVQPCDEGTARLLTNTFNYIHGEAQRDKYAQTIVDMLANGIDIRDMPDLLPDSADELDALIAEADVSIEAFEALSLSAEDDVDNELPATTDDNSFVSVDFTISVAQAAVIERSLKRVSDMLRGRNRRGRALEYIAVMAEQVDLPEDIV